MIHVYYGWGKGKTTCALGCGMRACGAGMNVLLVQFLKDNQSGELKTLPFEIFQAPDSLPFHPGSEYQAWVDGAVRHIKHSSADMIILDEFLDIVGGFISAESAVRLIKDLNAEVIITGHKAVKEILAIADYITLFEKIRHPYDSGVKARRGIEY